MKIALIGYGKMGKAIEAIALERGHEIVLTVGLENVSDFNVSNLKKADLAIEFTSPESAFQNISTCMHAGLAVVTGSTGWLDRKNEIIDLCNQTNGSFIHANNYSIGVNLFFELNNVLARLMQNQFAYKTSIEEIHHTEKKDAPSGTAIHLAEDILSINQKMKHWVLGSASMNDELSINSKRIDPAPGTHSVFYDSEIDSIEIKHTAHNRKGFALGAVLAAEYIHNKKGVFTMRNVLSL
jgi:4-hydroxy-tetrahydrodipicolinate reductase